MIDIISGFFGWIFSPIIEVLDFPSVPPELVQIIDQVFGYMRSAMGLFNFFCPLELIRPALAVMVAVWVIEHGYHVLMWVMRKIPLIGVK